MKGYSETIELVKRADESTFALLECKCGKKRTGNIMTVSDKCDCGQKMRVVRTWPASEY